MKKGFPSTRSFHPSADFCVVTTAASTEKFNAIGDKHDFQIPFTKNLVNIEQKHKPRIKVTYSYTGLDSKGSPFDYINRDFEEELGELNIVNTK